jgi:hypothetical protein
MLRRIAAVGFTGLVIDRSTSHNRATPREYLISQALGGQRPYESRDGALAFFDLRPYARELRARLGPDGIAALRRRALHDRSGAPKQLG